jgi:peptide/nickel transport system permease protein
VVEVPVDFEAPSSPAGEESEQERGFAAGLKVFAANRLAVAGLAVIAAFLLFCFVGPFLYRTNQVATDIARANLPPGAGHLLGTDSVGYDVLGRLMAGGRITLVVAILVAVLAVAVGLIWGATAAYVGGVVDDVMMRIVDAWLAIPSLFLLIFLDALLRPSVLVLIAVISALAWMAPARLVRAEVLSLKTLPYVEAARGAGATGAGVLRRHLLPNVVGTIVVNATFQVADAVLTVAALSFLGLGIPPPAANWGSMLSNGVDYVFAGYWWQIWPAGVAIVLVVVAFNFVGDGLRDAVDVRLRRR